ncbi:hypothetical protein [Micromonospora zhanjiangensis]
MLVAIDVAALFLRNRYWIGSWPETGAAGQVPAYLLGVIGAGAAAWAAGSARRHGLEEQISAARVHRSRLEAGRLGSTLIILLFPYLVGQSVAFTVTARTFPPGVHIWLGYVLLGLFPIFLAVALGWGCGLLLSPVFAACAASLGYLFLTALLDRVGFVVVSGRPEVAVDPLPLALRLGLVIVLLLVMLWIPVPAARERRRRRAAALAPIALALFTIMVTTTTVANRQPPGDRAVCVGGTPACASGPSTRSIFHSYGPSTHASTSFRQPSYDRGPSTNPAFRRRIPLILME